MKTEYLKPRRPARFARTIVVHTICFVVSVIVGWTVLASFMEDVCPATIDGRTCNDHGSCSPFGYCVCDDWFSGNACENTQVRGYLSIPNLPCNGRGNYTLSVQVTFAECVETVPSLFGSRSGGWDTQACADRVDLAEQRIFTLETATDEDLLGYPFCYCKSPFGGTDCSIPQCPMRDDGAICSNAGNATVGFIRNGTTTGIGCQCDSPLTLGNLTRALTPEQKLAVFSDLYTFQDGVCGTLYVTSNGMTVLVPSSNYVCHCDAKHYGPACEFGVCPQDVLGRFCSGQGHTGFGFGAATNVTENNADGTGLPLCADGVRKGCCLEDDTLCGLTEPACPLDRPYRCWTGCVAAPTVSKCDVAYEYGHLDDPSLGVRTSLTTGPNVMDSSVVWFEFRVRGSSPSSSMTVSYRGTTYEWDGFTEFWKFVVPSPTTREISLDAFEDAFPLTSFSSSGEFVEFVPAGFRAGDAIPEPMIRVRSQTGTYAVIDVSGSRVSFSLDSGDVLANVTGGGYLRPDGSTVDSETCFLSLSTCVWTLDYYSLDGSSRLCQTRERWA